jgi:tRNA(Glu) U13 pseudouridine synthase TruD
MRCMYLHSYQSKIWNAVAVKRWNENGATPVAGDLVFYGKDTDAVDAAALTSIGMLTKDLTIQPMYPQV